jgi:hypothetical protein
MCKCIFALLALAISLLGAPSWAATCGGIDQSPCPSITNTFSPGTTTGTYDFSSSGDGILVVKFVTVLTTFTLTATVNHTIDPLDPNEFPVGTVCVTYSTGQCDQYDFTGNAGGPNGVPVKGTDYKGLITLTLSYFANQTVHNPAFGHASGDSTTITEDILTAYYTPTLFFDPTMDGSTPGLSSVAALDEPLSQVGDTFCLVSPAENQTFSAAQVKVIEVTFQLFMFSGGSCTGTPIRDKTVRFSLSMTDSFGNFISFPALTDKEEANKFHWDNKNGLNEFDLSTVGLAPGKYTITLFSSKFSPQSVDITINP